MGEDVNVFACEAEVELREMRDKLKLEVLQRKRLQQMVIARTQEAGAAAQWAQAMQEECNLLNQRLEQIELELQGGYKLFRDDKEVNTDLSGEVASVCDRRFAASHVGDERWAAPISARLDKEDAAVNTEDFDFFDHGLGWGMAQRGRRSALETADAGVNTEAAADGGAAETPGTLSSMALLVEDLVHARLEKESYQAQAKAFQVTIAQLQQELDLVKQSCSGSLCSRSASRASLSDIDEAECSIPLLRRSGSLGSCESPPGLRFDFGSSMRSHARARSQAVSSGSSSSSSSSRNKLRRSKSLGDRVVVHARSAAVLLDAKLDAKMQQLEQHLYTVQSKLDEERDRRGMVEDQVASLTLLQSKLQQMESLLYHKDEQVTSLQATLRHAEDNFASAIMRVCQLESQMVLSPSKMQEAQDSHSPTASGTTSPTHQKVRRSLSDWYTKKCLCGTGRLPPSARG